MDEVEWNDYQFDRCLEGIRAYIAHHNPDLWYVAMILGVAEDDLTATLGGERSIIPWQVLGNGLDNLRKEPRVWTGTERKLVDTLFSITATMYANMNHFEDREAVQKWVAEQLRGMGFPNYPIGSSWGSLIDLR